MELRDHTFTVGEVAFGKLTDHIETFGRVPPTVRDRAEFAASCPQPAGVRGGAGPLDASRWALTDNGAPVHTPQRIDELCQLLAPHRQQVVLDTAYALLELQLRVDPAPERPPRLDDRPGRPPDR